MWKANGKTTTLQLFLDSLSPKTEKLSLEGTMDLSGDRLMLELNRYEFCVGNNEGKNFISLCASAFGTGSHRMLRVSIISQTKVPSSGLMNDFGRGCDSSYIDLTLGSVREVKLKAHNELQLREPEEEIPFYSY
jgi:hypothetical protein